MKTLFAIFGSLPAFFAAFLCPSVSAAQTYAITDLGLLKAQKYGSVETGAFALNDAGQVVGGDTQAFLWSGGKKTSLGALPMGYVEDYAYSAAHGINNRGQIIGSSGSFGPIVMSGLQSARGILYQNGKLRQLTREENSFYPFAINDRGQIVGLDAYRGFLYENGRLTRIGTLSRVPQGNRSRASALNRQGQVVGWSTIDSRVRVNTGELPTHAFLWQRGGFSGPLRDLGTLPGWVNSYAYSINDRGEVIGSVSDAAGGPYGVNPEGSAQAFLWRSGKMTGLGTLPGKGDSEAYGINSAGAIVGASGHRAFLWQGGTMSDLNTRLPLGSGWTLEDARAINNKGQITGRGTRDGQPHAYLLTPRGQD